MTIKKRLLASALVPVMAGWFAGHPARAEAPPASFEVAQAQPLTPEEEQLLKRKKREAVQKDGQPEGGEARPRRQAEDGQPAKRPQRDAAQPDARPKRDAAQQSGDDAQPAQRRPKPEADQAREAQPDARPKRDAAQQSGDDARPAQRKPKPEADQARETQPDARPKRDAAQQSGDDARPAQRKPQPEADQARDAQPDARPKRDAAQQPADDAQPAQRKPKPEADQARETQPDARPKRDAAQQPANDAQPPQRKPQPEADQARDAQPDARPKRDAAQQPGNDAQPPQRKPQPEADQARDAQPDARPKRDAAQQPGNDARPEQPGSDQARDAARPERPKRPAPPIEDRRSERERKDAAANPSKTDDTVVLPVEKGAAVLDSDKDADNRGGQSARDERRRERERQRQQAGDQPPPRNDAEAQRRAPQVRRADIEAARREEGRRRDRAPDFLGALLAPLVQGATQGYDAPRRFDDRTVYETDDGIVVRSDERRRLSRDASQTYYEDLPRGRVRETIVRADGGQIVTIYNPYGDVIQRSRIMRDGREVLLVYAPEADQEQRPPVFRDPGDDLPPMRLRIPVRDYIIDTSSDPGRDYYDFLAEPPVEQVERVYTIDEVKYSARLRDKVRRIDLDTVTFASGSAEVPMSQASTVRSVADAISKILNRDPGETFLIEGHTDAVGSDESNLVLSDRRAESVANVLTDVYGIPPENLVTQGYGERYLKVRTEVAEQQNRRVTIRRVTSLIRPATAGQ